MVQPLAGFGMFQRVSMFYVYNITPVGFITMLMITLSVFRA